MQIQSKNRTPTSFNTHTHSHKLSRTRRPASLRALPGAACLLALSCLLTCLLACFLLPSCGDDDGGGGATCGSDTPCQNDDGCCPSGCQYENDNDCEPFCGNNQVEPWETCDGDCPSSCDDQDACTMDITVGSADTCDLTYGRGG